MMPHVTASWRHMWRHHDMSNFCKLVSLWLCMYVIGCNVTSSWCHNACLQLKAVVAYWSLVYFCFSYVLFCFACIVVVPCVLHMCPNKPHCYNKPGVRRYSDLHWHLASVILTVSITRCLRHKENNFNIISELRNVTISISTHFYWSFSRQC